MGERAQESKCWPKRCPSSGPWDLVREDSGDRQGQTGLIFRETGSLCGRGCCEVGNQEPELGEGWQLELVVMPRLLTL